MQIIRGKIPCAKKVLIYGPEGIGKSTFASRFPEPVFIDTEGSTKDMDVARFEKASSWTMLLDQVRYVKMNPSVCRTLVIDTADWAEQMCVANLCARYGKKGVEDFGYGNGYVYAKEEFGRFLNVLEEVVDAGVNVVLTAHAQMRKFEQPDELGSYDRWELKLGKKTSSQTAPLAKEWADMVLFANYKTWSVAVDDKGKKRKAQGGARVMYTSHHPCWDAKNRYGLPEEMPFEYESIRSIIEGGNQTAAKREQPAEPVITSPSAPPVQTPTPPPAEKIPEQPVQQTMDLTPPANEGSVGEAFTGKMSDFEPDARIPKALRDLMISNNVNEWDVQRVVEARGYFPGDMPVYDYPKDFIEGVLVGAWDQVYAMIKEMNEKEAIPFN
ncbi:MAG TPA: hypothetical protein DGF66_07575 [Lachnoclostridium sp.]|nr:hypothetical protein [Lachnoclostridium sp.]